MAMMMPRSTSRPFAVMFAGTLLVAMASGCGDAPAPEPAATDPAVVIPVDRVLPPPETVPYPGRPWTIAGRPAVRGSITLAPGPEHCGWESSLFLTVGWPLGDVPLDSADARLYLRDPLGLHVAESMAAYDADVSLPAAAFDTGYRYGSDELWVDRATVDREVYVVRGPVVERWPRAVELLGCA